ncbi:hypothetical protein Vi05172_g6396 [Venturia inaequalis]|nr:hypothetical protein Vi05172_g6396 [Venturia inaequalis]
MLFQYKASIQDLCIPQASTMKFAIFSALFLAFGISNADYPTVSTTTIPQ